jgi:hypothetical protein
VLYVNFGLMVAVGGPFRSNPYLNPLVFMVNCDSMMNDVGTLLSSGFFKDVPFKAAWSTFATYAGITKPTVEKVEPDDDDFFDSKACDDDDDDDDDEAAAPAEDVASNAPFPRTASAE